MAQHRVTNCPTDRRQEPGEQAFFNSSCFKPVENSVEFVGGNETVLIEDYRQQVWSTLGLPQAHLDGARGQGQGVVKEIQELFLLIHGGGV